MGKNAFLRYLGRNTAVRTLGKLPPSHQDPPSHLKGDILLASRLLWTLQVLQDAGQLNTCLPLLANSPEFSFHAPGKIKTGLEILVLG